MNKVNDDNYIVIQGWMVNQLDLKGNELLIYALIHGFTQAENQKFTGSLQYIADWTNSTRQGVTKCLKKLEEKGYIIKSNFSVNGVNFCEYCTTKFNGVYNKEVEGVQQSLTGCTTKFNGGVQQSLHNNILDNTNNNTNNINNNISKHKHGEYKHVLLTDDQLEKLKDEFTDWQDKIKNLDEYIETTGKSYKNHYLVIKKWAEKDKKKQSKSNDWDFLTM